MKYFNELIDSYNKIKRREFKPSLDEATLRGIKVDDSTIPDLVQGSVDHVKSLFGNIPPEQMKGGIPVTGKDNKPYTLYSDDRGVHVRDGSFGAGRHLFDPNGNFVQSSPKTHKDLISAFGDLNQSKKAKNYSTDELEQMPQEDFQALQGLEELSPLMATDFADQTAVVNFQKIKEKSMGDLWNALPDSYRSKGAWGVSDREFSTYFSGGRPNSIESQIANAVTLSKDESGVYIEGAVIPNPMMVKQISNNLLDMVKLGGKDNLSDDEKSRIQSYIGVDHKGRVCLFRDSMDEGLVFQDANGFMKNLLDFFKERHGIVLHQVEYYTKNAASANPLRGKMLENASVFLALLNNGNRDMAGKFYDAFFKQDIMNAAQLNYDWVYKAGRSEAAIDVEDVPYFDEMKKFFDNVGLNLDGYLKGFISAHKSTMIRRPDLVLRKSGDKGLGKKADIVELYGTYEAALAAAMSSGLSEDSIILMNPEDGMKVDPLLTQAYAQAGLFTQPMFGLNVSLKTLVNDTAKVITVGKYSPNRIDRFLLGDNLDSPELTHFKAEVNRGLGLTSLDDLDIKETARTVMSKRNITNLPKKAITKVGNKNVAVNPSLDFLKSYRTEFFRLHTINDIQNDTLKRSISQILLDVEKKIDEYEDYPQKALEVIGRYHELQYLGVHKNDPKVKKYIAAKAYALGGSREPTPVEIKTLVSAKSQIFDLNSILQGFLGGYMADEFGTKFDVAINPKGLKIYSKANKEHYLFIRYAKSFRSRAHTFNISLDVSKGLIDHYLTFMQGKVQDQPW